MFVFNYPKEAKAFYMKENPADPRTVLCDDCLAPEGYGEIIGGSQREDDYDKLLARIKEQKLDRGVRLVSRSAEVRHLRPLGLRPGPRADGGMDLRDAAHPRGDRVPAADSPAVPVAFTSSQSSSRNLSPADPIVDVAFGGETLDLLESSAELLVGAIQRRPGLHPGFPGEIDHREQQVADFLDQLLRGSRRSRWGRLRLLACSGLVRSSSSTSPSSSRTFWSGPQHRASRNRRMRHAPAGETPSRATAALAPGRARI